MNLLAAGRLPPLVGALVGGSEVDLLAPVRLLSARRGPESVSREGATDRRSIAEALAVANAGYGHPAAAELAGRLADPATRVVITGQQPGLFGGPLYTLSKAVAASLWAERLRSAGEPAVALFWMATEDHDFRESSRVGFLTSRGPVRFELGDDDEPLVPLGSRRLDHRVDELLSRVRRAVPGERFHSWLDRLSSWYHPEASFGESFARLMVDLMGDRCPLLVDSMLPGLKAVERPWLRVIVEQRRELAGAFAERDRQIAAAGFPLQVKPQPGMSPLFLVHREQRRRIEWLDERRFGLRGDSSLEESVSWLLELIDEVPDRISAGVQARPVIQDAVFGTDLQILGPGELSYLPQAAPAYEVLGVPAPWAALRPQTLIVDPRQAAKITATGVPLEALLDPALDLNRLLAQAEETAFVGVARARIEELMSQARSSALTLDKGLEGPWGKTREQIDRALQTFADKVTAAAARRQRTRRERIESVRGLCLPLGEPQERILTTAHFPGKYGDRFVEAMFAQLELEPTNLQIISP